jgi:hypothetical protein
MPMPSTPQGLLLVIGSIFLSIAILGGGFEISAIKIPPVGNYPRIFAFFTGLIFVVIAIGVPNFLIQGEKPSQKLEVTSEKPEKNLSEARVGRLPTGLLFHLGHRLWLHACNRLVQDTRLYRSSSF